MSRQMMQADSRMETKRGGAMQLTKQSELLTVEELERRDRKPLPPAGWTPTGTASGTGTVNDGLTPTAIGLI
jgi:hypothetical protein